MSSHLGDAAALRVARPDEAATLSDLALRSKGYWGYSEEFLSACRDELRVDPEACAAGRVVVASGPDGIAGFYELGGVAPDAELVALFVEPDLIGTGWGRILLEDALASAVRQRFENVGLDADPGAEEFYRRHGATTLGRVPSGSIPGRSLARMRFVLG